MSPLTKLLLIMLLVFSWSSCRVTKDLKEGDKLLVKNKVKATAHTDVDEETLYEIIKQKPNTKLFFFFRFNAWLYNRFDEDKLAEKREKKKNKIELKNQRRVAKGKEPVKESSETWRDRIVNNIGEPPTVYDSLKTTISAEQLHVYFQKNGYFSSEIEHRLKFRTKRKIKSKYVVSPGKPHMMGDITWIYSDQGISEELETLKSLASLKKGARFNVEELDKSREAIASYLNNTGYFRFSKEYINFEVDTTKAPYTADINVVISNSKTESAQSPDSLVDVPHKKYAIGRIDFRLGYDPLAKNYDPTDRILEGRHMFEYIDTLNVNTELLLNNILLTEGEIYRLKDVQNTYKKLRNLGVFSYINIQFQEEGMRDGMHNLRCNVYLNSGKSQGTSFELTGTHRDGIWGANVKTSYKHSNLRKGAESLELKFVVGVEAVKPVSDTESEDDFTGSVNDNLKLNSFIVGPELKLSLHKLVFFPKLTKRFSTPLTSTSAIYNYQIRPDFERSLVELNFGYSFRESSKSKIFFSPFNWSIIRIDKSEAFQNRLNELNDLFLINSYRDHYIPSFLGGNWEYSNQTPQFQRRYLYNRLGVESAGLNFRLGFDLFTNQEKDDNGSYTINGVRFAQYVKFENDFRIYRNFSKNQSIATRLDMGYGLPYANSQVLPFEKSFFAGGSNGIRAWQARSLGPGSYRDTTALVTYNNLGEVRLTASSEYRFDLTNILEGAIFLDAGNVWIVKDESSKSGSDFSSDFASEIAIGGGFGFRFDFDFFLIRFDFGFKLKDPSLVKGERWFWEPKDDYNLFLEDLRSEDLTTERTYNFAPNFNLGIGYPF